MTNISTIRENLQGIREENSPERDSYNPMIHDAVSAIETCVDLIEQGIAPEADYHFNPAILTREDVKIVVANNKYADGIMKFIDLLLDGSKVDKRALEIACTDYKGWHYATTMGCRNIAPDKYIQQAREEATNDSPKK